MFPILHIFNSDESGYGPLPYAAHEGTFICGDFVPRQYKLGIMTRDGIHLRPNKSILLKRKRLDLSFPLLHVIIWMMVAMDHCLLLHMRGPLCGDFRLCRLQTRGNNRWWDPFEARSFSIPWSAIIRHFLYCMLWFGLWWPWTFAFCWVWGDLCVLWFCSESVQTRDHNMWWDPFEAK